MVEIEMLDKIVTIRTQGWDEIFCLRARVDFNIDNVTKIYRRPKSLRSPWFRTGGTYFPGIISAGRFRRKGRKEFWCHKFRRDSVVFELEDEEYDRVVVNVEDVDGVIARLSEKVSELWGKEDENLRQIEVEGTSSSPRKVIKLRT